MPGLELRSRAFDDNAHIPRQHAREGANTSPPLEWSEAPPGTSELVLICQDPDAPDGAFLHWLVTGIDPGLTRLDEGQAPPQGTAWRNDFGEPGWGGPAPPQGDGPHRYVFRLFALPSPISGASSPEQISRQATESALESATLIGLYER